MIGHSLDGYLNDMQFGVGVSRGREAILHVVNRLIEDRGDEVVLSMLLVDFKNAFNLVDREVMLQEVRIRCPAISRWAWYLDDDTIIGDTLVVREVLKVIMEDGPCRGLHLNIDKTEVFWLKDDPRSRFAGVFPQNIARPLHGVKLLCGSANANFDFSSELVMKRVSKSIVLMDTIAKLNDPQCELLLLRACAGISKLYFTMRICSPRVFEQAQRSFDAALRYSLERIVSASGPGFAFLASRLQSAGLQSKLLRHSNIVTSRPAFDNALNAFNAKMEIDLLSNPSEVAAPKLMKNLEDTYFTRVTQTAKSTFSLSTRQMAL
ncbi:hypothetical protein Tco_0809437 [Tanacetum coccineum]